MSLKSNALLKKHVANIREMFSYCRPSGSVTEQLFVDRFLTPLGFQRDEHKNLVLTIGEAPRVLWSSHMDTVHYNEGLQTTHFDWDTGKLSLSKASYKTSSCLGADDTAGIWLMVEMIKAGVQGVYVIHHAEESGCIGSTALATKNPEFFKDIDFAIAFDRRGYDSIVTHQVGFRTASDEFARDFANLLSDASSIDSAYKADDGGVYTDTNEYAHLVSECTSISVGYFSQHTRDEVQYLWHLIWLRNTLVKADFSQLKAYRTPGKESRRSSYMGGFGSFSSSSFKSRYDDDYDPWAPPEHRRNRYPSTLDDAVSEYPEIAAEILRAYGLSYTDFMVEVAANYGDAYADAG